MKLLMVDNYDSFTYNIVQYFGELGAEVEVFRNDEITIEGIAGLRPDRLVLSPGPCTPAEAAMRCASANSRARLLATVPENRYGFWGTRPILDHSTSGSSSRTSTACSRPTESSTPAPPAPSASRRRWTSPRP